MTCMQPHATGAPAQLKRRPGLNPAHGCFLCIMEEVGERGFEVNWPWPPLEPLRSGGTAAPWSKLFDSLLTAAREAPYLVNC